MTRQKFENHNKAAKSELYLQLNDLTPQWNQGHEMVKNSFQFCLSVCVS